MLFNSGLVDKSNILTSLVRNFLPDMLWAMSFYFFTIEFSKNTFKRYKLFNSVYGTFDLLDIMIYVLSVLFANLIEIFMRRLENEKR